MKETNLPCSNNTIIISIDLLFQNYEIQLIVHTSDVNIID